MAKRLKVLIAEDEYVNLMGLRVNLEDLGHEVIGEAKDGEEAVRLAAELDPDLILMDINMPGIDGIQAVEEINEIREAAGKEIIPVIIISGYHDQNLVDRANEVGVFAYLVKPVREEELKVAIEVCLARFREFQELKKEYQRVKDSLEARKLIEKAKGILMYRNNLKEDEAMRALQRKSRDSNKKLVDIAKEIIEADRILSI
ncbi:ANTAR domain-containing response regulator [Atrimonas thermophila]|uniref:ANTAR domain-containing response regulator n=1 Tax=Atrimonas thermophila TaxID=3064161 RepID=UPI00399D0CF6